MLSYEVFPYIFLYIIIYVLKNYSNNREWKRAILEACGDKKMDYLQNVARNRSWGKRGELPLPHSKAGFHPKEVLLRDL